MFHIFYVVSVLYIFTMTFDVQASSTYNKKKYKKTVVHAKRDTKSIMHTMNQKTDIVEQSILPNNEDRVQYLFIDTTMTNESLSEESNEHDISVQRSTPESRRMFNSLFLLEQAVVCDSTLTKDQLASGYLEQQKQYETIIKKKSSEDITQEIEGLSLRAQKYAQASISSLKKSLDEFDKD